MKKEKLINLKNSLLDFLDEKYGGGSTKEIDILLELLDDEIDKKEEIDKKLDLKKVDDIQKSITTSANFEKNFSDLKDIAEEVKRIYKEDKELEQKKIYNLLEYAIEFAWQLGEKGAGSRADYRHEIVEKVLEFSKRDDIPEDDIDLFIKEKI